MIIIALLYCCGLMYTTTASWPLYVDLIVFSLAVSISVPYIILGEKDFDFKGILTAKCIVGAMSGAVAFILMYFWGGLSVFVFWYLLALLIGIIAAYIPAGFFLAALILNKISLIPVVPNWIIYILIILDVINVILYILAFNSKKQINR